MKNKYNTPRLDCENVVTFTCSTYALDGIIELLENMKAMGSMGCTRDIIVNWGGEGNNVICFDGDGGDKLNNISINGLTQTQWKEERKRLEEIRTSFGTDNDQNDDISENCQ